MTHKNYPFLYRRIQGSFKGHHVSEEVLAQKKILKDKKEEKKLKLKTFKTLQYNITPILHINTSNNVSFHSRFYFSYDRHKNLFWVLREKETFARAIFTNICYVACTINRVGKLIYLRDLLDLVQFHRSHWQACYLYGSFNYMLLPCHIQVSEWIYTLWFAWMSRNFLLEADTISQV